MEVGGSIEALDFSALLRRGDRVVGLVRAQRPAAFRRLRSLVTAEPQTASRLPGFGSGRIPLSSPR